MQSSRNLASLFAGVMMGIASCVSRFPSGDLFSAEKGKVMEETEEFKKRGFAIEEAVNAVRTHQRPQPSLAAAAASVQSSYDEAGDSVPKQRIKDYAKSLANYSSDLWLLFFNKHFESQSAAGRRQSFLTMRQMEKGKEKDFEDGPELVFFCRPFFFLFAPVSHLIDEESLYAYREVKDRATVLSAGQYNFCLCARHFEEEIAALPLLFMMCSTGVLMFYDGTQDSATTKFFDSIYDEGHFRYYPRQEETSFVGLMRKDDRYWKTFLKAMCLEEDRPKFEALLSKILHAAKTQVRILDKVKESNFRYCPHAETLGRFGDELRTVSNFCSENLSDAGWETDALPWGDIDSQLVCLWGAKKWTEALKLENSILMYKIRMMLQTISSMIDMQCSILRGAFSLQRLNEDYASRFDNCQYVKYHDGVKSLELCMCMRWFLWIWALSEDRVKQVENKLKGAVFPSSSNDVKLLHDWHVKDLVEIKGHLFQPIDPISKGPHCIRNVKELVGVLRRYVESPQNVPSYAQKASRSISENKERSAIGQGGFGKVFKTKFMDMDGDCVVKVIELPSGLEGLTSQLCEFALFDRNYRNHERIQTPMFTDIEVRSSRYFLRIVSKYAALGTLKDGLFLFRHAAGRSGIFYFVLWCVLDGLRFMHSHQTLHQDINSRNVLMFSGKDGAKLNDFGLSRKGEGPRAASTLFTAPEVLGGESYTAASEIFAFACLWIELTSCENGKRTSILDPVEIPPLACVQLDGGKKLREMKAEECRILKAALSPDPKDRPTAEEIWQSKVFKEEPVLSCKLSDSRVQLAVAALPDSLVKLSKKFLDAKGLEDERLQTCIGDGGKHILNVPLEPVPKGDDSADFHFECGKEYEEKGFFARSEFHFRRALLVLDSTCTTSVKELWDHLRSVQNELQKRCKDDVVQESIWRRLSYDYYHRYHQSQGYDLTRGSISWRLAFGQSASEKSVKGQGKSKTCYAHVLASMLLREYRLSKNPKRYRAFEGLVEEIVAIFDNPNGVSVRSFQCPFYLFLEGYRVKLIKNKKAAETCLAKKKVLFDGMEGKNGKGHARTIYAASNEDLIIKDSLFEGKEADKGEFVCEIAEEVLQSKKHELFALEEVPVAMRERAHLVCSLVGEEMDNIKSGFGQPALVEGPGVDNISLSDMWKFKLISEEFLYVFNGKVACRNICEELRISLECKKGDKVKGYEVLHFDKDCIAIKGTKVLPREQGFIAQVGRIVGETLSALLKLKLPELLEDNLYVQSDAE